MMMTASFHRNPLVHRARSQRPNTLRPMNETSRNGRDKNINWHARAKSEAERSFAREDRFEIDPERKLLFLENSHFSTSTTCFSPPQVDIVFRTRFFFAHTNAPLSFRAHHDHDEERQLLPLPSSPINDFVFRGCFG